jgi:hypothetical protein
MAASAITVQQLTDAISKEWPQATLVEKSAYHRIALDRLTLGYCYIRGQRPAVEVISVKTAADLRKAVAAMRKVEAKAAKKAADAAKKAS